jgi:hypothetical protein
MDSAPGDAQAGNDCEGAMERLRLEPKKPRARRRRPVFGPRPLVGGDDPKAYDATFAGIASSLEPTDFIDELFVRDLTLLNCLVRRRHCAESVYLDRIVRNELQMLLHGIIERRLTRDKVGPKEKADLMDDIRDWAHEFSIRWSKGDPSTRKRVEKILGHGSLPADHFLVNALLEEKHFDIYKRLDSLAATAEARWHKMLREFDRHRVMKALWSRPSSVPEQKVLRLRRVQRKTAA